MLVRPADVAGMTEAIRRLASTKAGTRTAMVQLLGALGDDLSRGALRARVAVERTQAVQRVLEELVRTKVLRKLRREAYPVGTGWGRGRHVPIENRVRAIRYGAGLIDTKRFRGTARPLITTPLPDLDDPRVLGITATQDEL